MEYYLHLNDEQKGPFTLTQLQSMWRAGTITKETPYWKVGRDDWAPLVDMIDLLEPMAVPSARPAPTQSSKPAFDPNKLKPNQIIAMLLVAVVENRGQKHRPNETQDQRPLATARAAAD